VNPVQTTLITQLNDVLRMKLPSLLNAAVAAKKGFTEIEPNTDLDWSITTAPFLNADGANVGIKGLFRPENGVDAVPTVAPVTLPFHDSTSASDF